MTSTAVLTAALSLVCASPLRGQGAVATSAATTQAARLHPSVAPPRIDTPPTVDGLLDDTAWANASKISEFTQQQPVEAAPATESTDVYLAYDSQQIYVGIHAHYSDTSIIRANRADRDQTGRDDAVTLFFDPFDDQQRGYAFSVNGFGVQGDSLLSGNSGGGGGGGGGGNRNRGPGGGDPSWDALFFSAGVLVEDGWTAEMAIPFKSLRYPARGDAPHHWGFQI
ncbi:MAG: carbohydrate binding family 9 domain-containing protein, partial [Vicinamibacterales bacterium]